MKEAFPTACAAASRAMSGAGAPLRHLGAHLATNSMAGLGEVLVSPLMSSFLPLELHMQRIVMREQA